MPRIYKDSVRHSAESSPDNLKAVDVKLSEPELAALDAATAPKTVYPNWFTEVTTDAQHKEALGAA